MNGSQCVAKTSQANAEYLYFFEKCGRIAGDTPKKGEFLHGGEEVSMLILFLFIYQYIQPVLNKADKILSIQYLRGLAALGVVFCHFGLFTDGQIGVSVFFLISGLSLSILCRRATIGRTNSLYFYLKDQFGLILRTGL